MFRKSDGYRNEAFRNRMRENSFSLYLTRCSVCGGKTSKKYARANGGKCKSCVSGVPRESSGPKCPQCGIRPISAYKARNGYVCEACVRENDPVGYANEVRGFYD